MKKNRTEYLQTDIIRFIPKINIKLSKKEKKKELERKINREMKSNSGEFYDILKHNLRKNEITKETYLSKNISKEKRSNPNLLVSKMDNFEKFLSKKKRLLAKISKENSSFIKTYKTLKKAEIKNNKINSQQEYLNDVAQIYLHKNYDFKNSDLNSNENIFKYSILNDREFGDNINGDALRVIKEMDKEDFLKEQQLIFDFQDEIINEKINNKTTHPAEALIKKSQSREPDYGIDDISLIMKEKKKLDNYNEFDGIIGEQNYELKEELKGNSERKQRPSFLYIQIKKDINEMRKSIIDLEIMKDENKNEKLIKFKEKHQPRFSLFNNTYNNQENSNEKINECKNNEKKYPVIIYNNTEVKRDLTKDKKPTLILNGIKGKDNKKINFIKNNFKRYSFFNNLPNINKPKNNILQKRDSKSQSKSDFIIKRKSIKVKTQKFTNNLNTNENNSKEGPKLINLKKEKNLSSNSFLNNVNYNLLISESEMQKHMEQLKNKRKKFYEKYLNNSKEINLHGFVSHFQRITEEKNFGKVYNSNKYLKKNNFSYLMSNNDISSEDESEGMNLQKVDKKIENINYDSAEYLFGNRIKNKTKIL